MSGAAKPTINNISNSDADAILKDLQSTAQRIIQTEPILAPFLKRTILHPQNTSLESVIARTISIRLIQSASTGPGSDPIMDLETLTSMFVETLTSDELEYGYTMLEAVMKDMQACVKRDPACESVLEVLLYYKGFASLVCHRAAKRKWKKMVFARATGNGDVKESLSSLSKHTSLWLQSQASAAFGLDIHPAAEIGAGIMLDHGTGIVIGETATIGDDCTFLHGVTLGGTGKDSGDRHPKVGKNVLIGANASILGNIKIGDGAKIGAGSVVLKPIPHGATAVGVPAKIIGFAKESNPGSSIDATLDKVVPIMSMDDSLSGSTVVSSGSDSSLDDIDEQLGFENDPNAEDTVENIVKDADKQCKAKSVMKSMRRSMKRSVKGPARLMGNITGSRCDYKRCERNVRNFEITRNGANIITTL